MLIVLGIVGLALVGAWYRVYSQPGFDWRAVALTLGLIAIGWRFHSDRRDVALDILALVVGMVLLLSVIALGDRRSKRQRG